MLPWFMPLWGKARSSILNSLINFIGFINESCSKLSTNSVSMLLSFKRLIWYEVGVALCGGSLLKLLIKLICSLSIMRQSDYSFLERLPYWTPPTLSVSLRFALTIFSWFNPYLYFWLLKVNNSSGIPWIDISFLSSSLSLRTELTMLSSFKNF